MQGKGAQTNGSGVKKCRKSEGPPKVETLLRGQVDQETTRRGGGGVTEGRGHAPKTSLAHGVCSCPHVGETPNSGAHFVTWNNRRTPKVFNGCLASRRLVSGDEGKANPVPKRMITTT